MIKNFYYSIVLVIFVGLIILACLGKNDCLCIGTFRISITGFLCLISLLLLLSSFICHVIDIVKIELENNKLTKEINTFKFDNLQKEKELTLNRLKVFYNQKMKESTDKSFSELYEEYQEFTKLFADKKDSNPTEKK